MKYFRSRFNSSLEILEGYEYPQPFHLYLKQFFRTRKKYGSKDRKAISSLLYKYFRLANVFKDKTVEQRLLLSALMLNEVHAEGWKELAQEHGLGQIEPNDLGLDQNSKLSALAKQIDLDAQPLFPASVELGIESKYNAWEYIDFKPKLWIKNHGESPAKLERLGFHASELLDHAFYADHLEMRQEFRVQVQDLGSQILCSQIKVAEDGFLWDCCAGAGGKTLAIKGGKAYVSDLRPTILENASRRFRKHGKRVEDVKDFDLVKDPRVHPFQLPEKVFDAIIADVPCSGSGTWFRTPEHFSHFKADQITSYVERQRAILRKLKEALTDSGKIYYITCSIFKEENEGAVTYAKEIGLKCISSQYHNGFDHGSDSMFMAVFQLKQE